MIKTTATKLKNHLGKFMRAVQDGKEVLITDRDRPVAKLIPIGKERSAGLRTRAADSTAPAFGMLIVKPHKIPGVDSLALLLADRTSR